MRLAGGGILIDSKNRILLLKRSDYTKAFPGYWTIPSGRGEEGENAKEITIREVFEETGLVFIPTELYSKAEVMNSGEEILSNRFLGTYSGSIKIQEVEADGYAWYFYEECKKLKLAFNYSELIEKLYKDGILN